MILWFDFDGTLVDVRAKYLGLYHAFGNEHGARAMLPDDEFWALKRGGMPNAELAVRSGLAPEVARRFASFVEAGVEQERALRRDTLFPSTLKVLRTLASKHRCQLISMRRDYAMLRRQLTWLGICDLFELVHEVPREGTEDDTPKAAVIRRHGAQGPALTVGDSEMEIRTGRQLGIPCCAVPSGIRTRERLAASHPDYIVESLFNIIPIVGQLAISA
jgi:phosphoglycolate phosphatase-like HAD superfamily hydrolase